MAGTSLTEAVAALPGGAAIVAAGFLRDTAVVARVDGTVSIGERTIAAHPDATILLAAFDDTRLVTGGDDGRVVAIVADGTMTACADEKGRWIDALALRPDGALAWSAGKSVAAQDAKGAIKRWTAPSSVRGLAFMPKGYRVAVSHYSGVSLWFPNTDAGPEVLEWAGSHLDVTVSPDGRFAVSSMQESALHGWRLADKKNMRMTGYPSKTRSMSWSADGQWLATSGADAAIVWPFQTKDGPMGKAPRELAPRSARVTRVAFHPKAMIVAIGYVDGWVLLCRMPDAAEILVRRPDTPDPITALTWDAAGKRLVFGTEGGAAGVLTLPAA